MLGLECNIIKTKSQMDLRQRKNYDQLSQLRKDIKEGIESDESYQIQKTRSKRVKTRKVQTAKKWNFNNSKWNLQENLLYKDFIIKNKQLFQMQRQERRAIKINVLISKQVKTRTSGQCRSHHQKMLIYHHTLDSIVEHIESLQTMRKKPQRGQTTQSEEPVNIKSSILEMKEIQFVNQEASQYWNLIVQDVGFMA